MSSPYSVAEEDGAKGIGMTAIFPGSSKNLGVGVTQETLDSMNVSQASGDNKDHLKNLGGVTGLASQLGVNLRGGLTESQVTTMREKFGSNQFPEKPMVPFWRLFLDSFNDTVLLILIAAAVVSLILGMIEHPDKGWIEGTAILIAVVIVAFVTSTNDYQKELQFRALEASADKDLRCTVFRGGETLRIDPVQLVVGDVVSLKVRNKQKTKKR